MISNAIQLHDQIESILAMETEEFRIPRLLKFGLKLMARGLQKDIEEEEEKPKSLSLKASFVIVLLLHLGVAAAIAYFPHKKAMAMEKEDKQFLKEEYAGTDEYPRPTAPKVITRVPKYTTSYIIKQGDTIDSIVNKFKLNKNRLMKMNNLKEGDKLSIGKELKFM